LVYSGLSVEDSKSRVEGFAFEDVSCMHHSGSHNFDRYFEKEDSRLRRI
jgi:hypothetical protein